VTRFFGHFAVEASTPRARLGCAGGRTSAVPAAIGDYEDVPVARCFGTHRAAVVAAWCQGNDDCIVRRRDNSGSWKSRGPWDTPLDPDCHHDEVGDCGLRTALGIATHGIVGNRA
jgi:hypothetical protein